MSALIYQGTADAIGRIRYDTPEIAAAEISRLAGKRLTIEIKKERILRTQQQNKALWGHVYAEAVAESVELVDLGTGLQVFQCREDVHGFAKRLLLSAPKETKFGMIHLLGSTTTLSTDEFQDYTEALCAKLAGYGVYIPPIGE